MLEGSGLALPVARKTGTTICGVVFADGVILGADTRATSDTIVADKECAKIHKLAGKMYCCGAGTAADCDFVTRMVASQLELHALNTGRQSVPVVAAVRLLKQHLFRYQGHVGAALIVGGVDAEGAHLTSIHPHGSSDSLPYTSMGSGSLAAMAVLESRYRPGMTREEGKALVRDAVAAGIFNDLGSGSNVDVCVITSAGVEYLRPFERANPRPVKQATYRLPTGTTPLLPNRSFTSHTLLLQHEFLRHLTPPADPHDADMDTDA